MKKIPQRELRNQSGAVLRQAEAGEEFVITVDGRPVAVLGPYRKRQWVSADVMGEILATPSDSSLMDDLDSSEADDLQDPWQRNG